MKDLLAAAEDLHRAIRSAVDPEAFSDFHGDHPSSNCATRKTSSGHGDPARRSPSGRLRRWPNCRPIFTPEPAAPQPTLNHEIVRIQQRRSCWRADHDKYMTQALRHSKKVL